MAVSRHPPDDVGNSSLKRKRLSRSTLPAETGKSPNKATVLTMATMAFRLPSCSFTREPEEPPGRDIKENRFHRKQNPEKEKRRKVSKRVVLQGRGGEGCGGLKEKKTQTTAADIKNVSCGNLTTVEGRQGHRRRRHQADESTERRDAEGFGGCSGTLGTAAIKPTLSLLPDSREISLRIIIPSEIKGLKFRLVPRGAAVLP
ncbi:hypothetical protein V1477_016320, partial [Vespula maculifrons]